MKLRNLEKLVETEFFNAFRKKYKITTHSFDDIIFIKNDCLVFCIYGYLVENCLYFDIYNFKRKTKASLRVLSSETTSKENRIVIYNKYDKIHLIPTTNIINQSNISNTLEAEKDFFVFIEIIDTYLEDLMNCELEKYEEFFKPINPSNLDKEWDTIKSWFP